jgi:ABC-type antimicrobial peptide transport system permease subunit
MKQRTPPRLARWLWNHCCRDEEKSALIRDLDEYFSEISIHMSRMNACRWYWKQVIGSIFSFSKRRTCIGGTMLKNYLITTIRKIKRHKAFSIINISGLTLGMACCILILLWIQDEMSYDRFFNKSDELYRLVVVEQQQNRLDMIDIKTPWLAAETLKESIPEIRDAARFHFLRNRILRYEDRLFNENSFGFADPSFFDLFSFEFIKGNPRNALKDLNSIVLTEEMAEKYFGREDPVGKTMILDNKTDLSVTGVIKNIPHNTHFESSYYSFDCLVPISLYKNYASGFENWEDFRFIAYILLEKGIDYRKVNEKMAVVFDEHTKSASDIQLFLQPIKSIRLVDVNGEPTGMKNITMFSLLAGLVLLIACFNFTNLTTARALSRAKEIGIRKVVGANKGNLIRQFLGESLCFSLFALILAVLLVYLLLPMFSKISGKSVSFSLFSHPSQLCGLILITFFTGLIAGAYPAFFLSSFRPQFALKANFRVSSKKAIMKRSLVIIQFAVSIFLLISASVSSKQFNFFLDKDIGFEKKDMCIVGINKMNVQRYEAFRNEIKNNPRIQNVTASGMPPGIGSVFATNRVHWDGKDPEQKILFHGHYVRDDFFKTYRMKILKGNVFSRLKSTNFSDSIVISDSAARIMGYENPIGKRVNFADKDWIILGVVNDIHIFSLQYELYPVLFVYRPERSRYIGIKLDSETEAIPATLSFIENKWKEYFPDSPFEYVFLEGILNKSYDNVNRTSQIYRNFALLAIFISCLGLFGLVAHSAEQRTKEIGIRKVLGAPISTLITLMIKESLVMVAAANVIAWPIAFYVMNKWLENFAYRASIGISLFLLPSMAALMIALFTVSIQSIKAATANPVDSLRYE